MKIPIISKFFVLLVALLVAPISYAAEGDVILNPGTVSGTVSLTGYDITSVTVYAIDTNKNYSASVTASAPGGATSISYTLTVEGGYDYYVMADVYVAAADTTRVSIPPGSPVSVVVGSDVPLNLAMEPAVISGTISTGSADNTINNFSVYAYLNLPQFDNTSVHYTLTSANGLSVPGDVGRDYTLLIAPNTTFSYIRGTVGVDGLNYNIYDYTVTTPASGSVVDRDYPIDVSAATISGYSLLNGINVTYANVYGYANSPTRNSSVPISDLLTGAYSLPVDEGAWRLRSVYSFLLPDADPDLTGLYGNLYTSMTPPIDVLAGDELEYNFDIDPGFIPGTVSLWGANTNFYNAQVRAYNTTGGLSYSGVDPDTGKFLFVLTPGEWQADNYQSFSFDYPDDPDTYLRSSVYQYYYDTTAMQSVSAGVTSEPTDLSYGTITVRRYFYVADDGVLSSPSIKATRSASPYSVAWGYGSHLPTTEGQAIVTLLLPGEYSLEAFANVDGSNTEFGTVNITVEEGDVVVIGGTARPTIKVTNPTSGEVVCGTSVVVEGTATDDVGVASITINGESVSFSSTNNPNDPNEVGFSHEVTLTLDQANEITVEVADTDGTDPIALTMTVYSERCGPEELVVAVDIKPGSCPNPLNTKSKGVLPVAIVGTSELDVSQVDVDSIRILDVPPVRSSYEDVATPFYPLTGKQDKLDCHEAGADGWTDLSLKFDRQQLVEALNTHGYSVVDGEVIAVPLTGSLLEAFGGNPISGEDVVIILNKGK